MRSLEYAKLAKDAALLRWSGSDRGARRDKIATRMGKLHGLPQKVGQMLSFGGDDDEWDSPYAALQDGAEPMSIDAVHKAINASERFGDGVDVEPSAKAASLGQVHRARLSDGAVVAIKVRYPDIVPSVKKDLRHLHALAAPFGNLKSGFNFRAYQEMLGSQLERELDYRHEADNQQRFFETWRPDPQVVVPRVYRERCCDEILVATWEDGEHHRDVVRHWTADQKRKLGELLLRFFFKGLLTHGCMQADWHPGNFRFRRGESRVELVVYDFGCLCELSSQERGAIAALIAAARAGSHDVLSHFLQLGFSAELLEPLAPKLHLLCRAFFEPLCQPCVFNVARWRLGERVSEILGEDRWNFRFAAPPHLLMLMRAFHGLFYYLRRWGVDLDWTRCVAPELLAGKAKGPAPAKHPVACRTRLKIRISDGSETKVQLTQPATVLQRLDEVLEPAIQEKLKRQQVDLAQIAADAESTGYAPGEIFHVQDGGRSVRVWLE